MVLLYTMQLNAQQTEVKGVVMEESVNGDAPITGVSIYWEGTNFGTFSDENGRFELEQGADQSRLVFNFMGYETDTVIVTDANHENLTVYLKSNTVLDQVDVVKKTKTSQMSMLDPLNVTKVTEKELEKAACCSLAECFETSPTVDVSFSDAVTGTRQIQMLGLAGPYIQITREAIPDVRGLNTPYGMELIPGTWIENIFINKGTGSVTNGYESIAGQINIELRKPEDTDKLFVNGYGNQGGRVEGNLHYSNRFNKKWSTAVLLHARTNSRRNDNNNDGFLDMPIGDHRFALNRWKYVSDKSFRMQMGVKVSAIDIIGGQKDFENHGESNNLWGMTNNLTRLEGWAKCGFIFENAPWKSLGFQLSASNHDQDSRFGDRDYDAKQNSYYFNAIFQTIIGNTNHGLKMGTNAIIDEYDEQLTQVDYSRNDQSVGVFGEYTFKYLDKFTTVAGLRGDYHNQYDFFVTPRLNMRYAFSTTSVLRAFGGRGLRTANIISENMRFLASNRDFVIHSQGNDTPYGLDAEIAWNYGVSYANKFKISGRDAAFNIDFYRTEFENQIVVDMDQNTQEVNFYNLDGQSYSNSVSTQFDYELIKNFNVRLAYRWYDVKTDYQQGELTKPLLSPNRAFVNLAYETESKWKFDYTVNWQDQKRIPFTGSNPVEFQLEEQSPDYILMNTQITKEWSRLSVYAGMENIMDYRQDDPIIDSANPNSDYFDSALVWGPIFGRNTYVGLRYRM